MDCGTAANAQLPSPYSEGERERERERERVTQFNELSTTTSNAEITRGRCTACSVPLQYHEIVSTPTTVRDISPKVDTFSTSAISFFDRDTCPNMSIPYEKSA